MDNVIILSDLHLTTNAQDEYRWNLFGWLEELLNRLPHTVHYLLLLGDLTDAKDRHPSDLVNRLVTALVRLYRVGGLREIFILHGNHDGVDPSLPYFKFLSHFPYIHYINEPTSLELNNRDVLFLPHSRNPVEDWKHLEFHDKDYIFLHGTVTGAVAENSQRMEGIPLWVFAGARGTILAGDVHVPQRIGPVEYVGAPYPIHFGDTFEPRALLYLDKQRQPDLHIPTLKRHMVTIHSTQELTEMQFSTGDQIKVKVSLTQSEYIDWPKRKLEVQKFCQEKQLMLCGLQLEPVRRIRPRLAAPEAKKATTPRDVLEQYCTRQKLSGMVKEVGIELLETTKS